MRVAYTLTALAIFAIEVFIALFVRDGFIRPYIGDVLAVTLVYATLRAATPLRLSGALLVTLAIALTIEVAQVLDLLGKLGLGGNQVARVILGGAFDMLDLAAYAAGGVLILIVEAIRSKRA